MKPILVYLASSILLTASSGIAIPVASRDGRQSQDELAEYDHDYIDSVSRPLSSHRSLRNMQEAEVLDEEDDMFASAGEEFLPGLSNDEELGGEEADLQGLNFGDDMGNLDQELGNYDEEGDTANTLNAEDPLDGEVEVAMEDEAQNHEYPEQEEEQEGQDDPENLEQQPNEDKENEEPEEEKSLTHKIVKGLAIAGGVAAVGAGGYWAYNKLRGKKEEAPIAQENVDDQAVVEDANNDPTFEAVTVSNVPNVGSASLAGESSAPMVANIQPIPSLDKPVAVQYGKPPVVGTI